MASENGTRDREPRGLGTDCGRSGKHRLDDAGAARLSRASAPHTPAGFSDTAKIVGIWLVFAPRECMRPGCVLHRQSGSGRFCLRRSSHVLYDSGRLD